MHCRVDKIGAIWLHQAPRITALPAHLSLPHLPVLNVVSLIKNKMENRDTQKTKRWQKVTEETGLSPQEGSMGGGEIKGL